MNQSRKNTKSSLAVLFILVCFIFNTFPQLPLARAQAVSYIPSSSYLSPIKNAPMAFTGVGVTWHQVNPPGTAARLLMRFNTVKNGWSNWEQLQGDLDIKDGASDQDLSTYLPTDAAAGLQYKVLLESNNPNLTPVIENIEITYLNARKAVSISKENLVASIAKPADNKLSQLVASVAGANVKIISRADWGADESLRDYTEDRPAPKLIAADPDFIKTYSEEMKIVKKVAQDDNGKDLTWPLQYPEKVSKFIIHHTATTKDLDDPKQAIRNIYYWHAISKGWGDIGYNYIIDQQGNIYEGRYGGDGVVGGHAGKSNVGSIGIAVLGNYQDNIVPETVVTSLAALIKLKAEKYGIDPAGTSLFRGEISDNVLGHRDVMSTNCPGDKLYSYLPLIRTMAKIGFKTSLVDKRRIARQKEYDYNLANNIPTVDFSPGGRQRLQVSLQNTGAQKWGANTYLLVSNDENAKTFLNLDILTRSSTAGKEVLPGGTVTFDIYLQAGYVGGISTFELFPMVNGDTKIEKFINIPMRIKQAKYDYEFVSLKLGKDKLKGGETTEAVLTLKNTSDIPWKRDGKNRIRIGTEEPQDHISFLLSKADTRLATMTEREVDPGKNATFVIKLKAPAKPGTYREYFAPVVEGVTWMKYKQNYLEINVFDANNSAKYVGAATALTMLPSERKIFSFDFRNDGNATWEKTGAEPFSFDLMAERTFRVSAPMPDKEKVLPGQTVKVSFTFVSPAAEGSYSFRLMPRKGANKLLSSPQIITVNVGKQSSSISSTSASAATGGSSTTATGGTSATATAAVNSIKVDLGFRGNPVISADGVFSVYDGLKLLGSFARNEKVTVLYDQQKYQVKGDKQAFVLSGAPRFEAASGIILRINNYENRPAWNTTYNDNLYKGKLYVYYYENTLHVVNELPLEDYLKGLAEISAKDPYEKIKAVIVLARSYAKYYLTVDRKFPGAPFDLTDDPERSQKYLGYGFEQRNTTGVKAVNDTAGQVVTYNGKVIKTPYFSSDDGRTRSAQEVWGWTDTPYLQSVDDPGCQGKTLSGHGVGLSGCGAVYFANQGKSYIDIIKYYYKGVEVNKI